MKKEPKWLNQKIVLTIHLDQLKQHGGSQGIRDRELLKSALDRPRNKWSDRPSFNPFDLAASLCIGIAKNHLLLMVISILLSWRLIRISWTQWLHHRSSGRESRFYHAKSC